MRNDDRAQVQRPGRDVGQGITWVKKTSMATPMQISGTTIGRARAPSSAGLNGKRKRQSSSAVIAPRMTLIRCRDRRDGQGIAEGGDQVGVLGKAAMVVVEGEAAPDDVSLGCC